MKNVELSESVSESRSGLGVSTNGSGLYQSKLRIFRNELDTQAIVCDLLSKLNYSYRKESPAGFVAYKISDANNAACKTTIQVSNVSDNLTEVRISGHISSGSKLMSFLSKRNVGELVSAIDWYSANPAVYARPISRVSASCN